MAPPTPSGPPLPRRRWPSGTIEDSVAALGAKQALAQRLIATREIQVRREITEALERIGPAATPALSALFQLLADRTHEDLTSVADALNAIAPNWTQTRPGHDALAALIRHFAATDQYTPGRGDLVGALRTIGPPARAAVPLLLDMMADQYSRNIAMDAIRQIDPSVLGGSDRQTG